MAWEECGESSSGGESDNNPSKVQGRLHVFVSRKSLFANIKRLSFVAESSSNKISLLLQLSL